MTLTELAKEIRRLSDEAQRSADDPSFTHEARKRFTEIMLLLDDACAVGQPLAEATF